MFLHEWNPSPILVSFDGLHVRWYGLLVGLGAAAGFFVARWLSRREGIDPDHFSNLFALCLVFGLVGARLWHVSNEWDYYRQHPAWIPQIWRGGLAIHGAVLASTIVFYLYARARSLSFWRMADIGAVGLILGQAVGRWGNYFNQELFGRPTGLPWGIPIDPANRPPGYEATTYFHPTFLYESLGSFAIFAILMALHARRMSARTPEQRRGPIHTPGTIALLYFILYSLVRLGTESLRIDDVPVVAGIRLPILTSIVLIALAILVWFLLQRRAARQARR